jgi:hypothetical protein
MDLSLKFLPPVAAFPVDHDLVPVPVPVPFHRVPLTALQVFIEDFISVLVDVHVGRPCKLQ